MVSALGFGDDVSIRAAYAVGLALGLIAFQAARRGLDESSIAFAVLAAILGAPIVWEYNYALLFVPIAIARPRFSPLWAVPLLVYWTHQLPRPLLGAGDLESGGVACCRPEDVPLVAWAFSHAPPGLWPAVGNALLAAGVIALVHAAHRRNADAAKVAGHSLLPSEAR